MNTKHFALFLICVPMMFVNLASCGSDEPNTGATGGSGGATLDGGSGQSGEGGASGASANTWKKGVVGSSTGVIALAKNAGNIQGVSLSAVTVKTLDSTMEDAGDADAESLPQTAPVIDGQELGEGNFAQMILPVLPYQANDESAIPPFTMVVNGDWSTGAIQHFDTWPSPDIDMSCYTPYPTSVNGVDMKAYNGFTMDTAICLNRWFLVTNGSNKVWELFPDGTRAEMADLQKPLSSIMCHPQGYLLVSSLSTYVQENGFHVNTPSEVHKVNLDGTAELKVEMPMPDDYATNNMFGLCGAYPGVSPEYIAPGMNIFLMMHPDGSLLVGEMGAQRIYKVDPENNIDEFAVMDELTIGGILAPNEVIYTVLPPMTNQTHDIVHKGTRIRAFAEGAWQDVVEVGAYEAFTGSMQNFSRGTPCAEDPSGICYQSPVASFKLAAGTTPMLLMTDPIKGELTAIQLDMNGSDPSDAGTAGSAGSSGSAGASGSAGTAGSAGSAGSAGAGGTAGSGS
ncbi:MAG: hypothetical protein P1P90_02375 [Patescibacteria group bacterium]|nr:hypothetical protein [Patescibacteria group bacterium]